MTFDEVEKIFMILSGKVIFEYTLLFEDHKLITTVGLVLNFVDDKNRLYMWIPKTSNWKFKRLDKLQPFIVTQSIINNLYTMHYWTHV